MNIKGKLILGSSLLAAIPVILAGLIIGSSAIDTGEEALEVQVRNQLVSLRELKKTQIEDYFDIIKNQALTMSNDEMIIEAMTDLKGAFYKFSDQAFPLNSDMADYRQKLGQYYTTDFSEEYKKLNHGMEVDAKALLNSIDDDAVALQYRFIQANPNPLGSKDALSNSQDDSLYNFYHQQYHPHIRDFLKKFGYYDIFLVDPKSGKVVYTVFKELDFATSLIDGPYADTGLGRAFKAAKDSGKGDFVYLDDFAAYTPSYDSPASFISSPIMDKDGNMLGVLIFQMPIDSINEVMTSDERWTDVGLGASGETYLVGSDFLMRSQSRSLMEDKAGFMEAIKDINLSEHEIGIIDSKETTIGLFPVKTKATEAALAGNSGFDIINDYHNVAVLSAYAPINILGLNWAVLAELDKEEAFASITDMKNTILLEGVLIILIMAAIAIAAGMFFANSISRPLVRLGKTMNEIEANSDLTRRVDITSKDELGEMARSLNSMLDNFQNIVKQVMGSTSQLASAAEEMSAVTVQTSQGIQEQQAQTDQLATAMNEMAATVQEVARNALEAADAANKANEESTNGSQVVNTAVSAINALAEDIQSASSAINKVEEDSDRIGTVLDVIKGIAEQTNLLALNAAIEAARAGEQGRGFAVVADEVRTLAARTQDSTREIQEMIESLQGATKEAVTLMDHSRERSGHSVEQTTQAGTALETITAAVEHISRMNTQIASAAEEQSSVTEEINTNVVTINQVADQSAEGAEQTARASEDLARLANDLQGLVSQFKS